MKKKLDARTDQVVQGLGQCQLSARRLTTKELIKLMYESYNPLTALQEVADTENEYALSGTLNDVQPIQK